MEGRCCQQVPSLRQLLQLDGTYKVALKWPHQFVKLTGLTVMDSN